MIEAYEEAETFLLEALDNFSTRDTPSYLLEDIARAFINLPETATFNEFVIAYEDEGWLTQPEQVFDNPLREYSTIEIASIALQKYQNFKKKVARPDNWLNPNSEIADSKDWQAGYRNAVAEFLLADGEEAAKSLSYYGWRQYSSTPRKGHPVAVFHVLEHTISEFVDTFSDNREEAGITGEVLLSTGETIYMRWEGTLSEIIRSITG